MKLFIITIEEMWDYSAVPHKPEVFFDKSSATSRVNALYDEVASDYEDRFDSGFIHTHTDGGFKIWRSYDYNSHHRVVQLHEHEVSDVLIRQIIDKR